MINLTYNPFNKDLRELSAIDLLILKDTAEGWFVEYKSQALPPKTVAKSIAAFANHYGGWILYGIESTRDGTNKADKFPGIDAAEVNRFIEQLRNASKDCVNPSVYYEHKVLNGPCSEIGLDDQKCIVVVAVPSGPDAPYVHIDGRVYRRIADASDPKMETDRFVLDNLWQCRREARERLNALLSQRYSPQWANQEVSYLDLFFLPDPLGVSHPLSEITFDEFVQVMSDKTTLGITNVFDNFFPMADGVIGRDVNINAPDGPITTWRHFFNGSSIVSMPLSTCDIGAVKPQRWLSGYKHENDMLKLLSDGNYTRGVMLDLNQLMLVLLGCARRQRQLMKIGNVAAPLYIKAALHNVQYRIPFLDTGKYIEIVSQHGLPVIQYGDTFAPADTTFESLILMPNSAIRIEPSEEEPSRQIETITSWQAEDIAEIAVRILNALGLPHRVISDDLNAGNEDSWWPAAERAKVVNMERNHRMYDPR